MSPKRGEIWWVNFDPTIGHEIRKTRPAVVLQNDVANKHSPVTIVAAITTKFNESPYPTEVLIEPEESGLLVPSSVLLNQIRTVDLRRLTRRAGRLRPGTMKKVSRAIAISLGILEV